MERLDNRLGSYENELRVKPPLTVRTILSYRQLIYVPSGDNPYVLWRFRMAATHLRQNLALLGQTALELI